MRATCSMLAAGMILLASQGTGQAQTNTPLPNTPLPNAGLGTISNLKFTGDVQTEEVLFRRGYYRGYGYRSYYGYGYRPYYYGGYRPYYAGYGGYGYGGYGGYCSPYSYSYAPSYGYRPYYGYGYRPNYNYGYRGYPSYGGYRRIDMTEPAPAATTLAAAPRQAKISGPIKLTQFTPAQNGNYNRGPSNIVPVPNHGGFQNAIPAPSFEQDRPTLPRDGLPVSIPSGMSGEVFPIVYGGPTATPVSAGSGFSAR